MRCVPTRSRRWPAIRRTRGSWALISVLACGTAPEPREPASASPSIAAIDGELDDILDAPAPEFEVGGWIVDGVLTSQGPSLASLRGRVVLVRFWTDTCPYCRASAPGFAQLDREFRDRGLVVIGIHHAKPRPTPRAVGDDGLRVDAAHVADVARAWGMDFAIGLDDDWRTIDSWWLTRPRRATSATFLIDRTGRVRWVHPGPELHPGGGPDHAQCRRDFADMTAQVEALLRE